MVAVDEHRADPAGIGLAVAPSFQEGHDARGTLALWPMQGPSSTIEAAR